MITYVNTINNTIVIGQSRGVGNVAMCNRRCTKLGVSFSSLSNYMKVSFNFVLL